MILRGWWKVDVSILGALVAWWRGEAVLVPGARRTRYSPFLLFHWYFPNPSLVPKLNTDIASYVAKIECLSLILPLV